MEEKKCGCKGIRSCLLCEPESIRRLSPVLPEVPTFSQCRVCGILRKCEGIFSCLPPCQTRKILMPVSRETLPKGVTFDGVTVITEFISEEEERELVQIVDQQVWVESQSGRHKQDYGPKVNFKKRKLKIGSFSGLPSYSEQLINKMRREVEGLTDFRPVEMCNLDYSPERGAAIDPHLDDTWLWGERLVTLNLLSDTILTFSLPSSSGEHVSFSVHVEIHMPRRSLVMVAGTARHRWHHCIKRTHVTSRRVAMTLRELSEEFLPGGHSYSSVGRMLLEVAANFSGQQTNSVI